MEEKIVWLSYDFEAPHERRPYVHSELSRSAMRNINEEMRDKSVCFAPGTGGVGESFTENSVYAERTAMAILI